MLFFNKNTLFTQYLAINNIRILLFKTESFALAYFIDKSYFFNAAYLADEIAKLGPYEFICTGRPDEGIPAVCFKLKDGEDPGYTLYDLSERLRLRGWQVPAFTLGGEATDIVVMRIMCRRGFEMDFAELLLEDYKASLKYLSDHPKLQGIAQQNSFKHT